MQSLPERQLSSVAEVGELVRSATAAGQAVYPAGGRTMFNLGNLPATPGTIVDLRQLNEVIDYPVRDMTITVQAGITIARLQSVLHAEKQRLPIDVPLPDPATLGGAAACNASGPRRYGYGTLRDYVLGISAVNDAGDEIKAGGRVVKNVAGYDLCKLFLGSLGTLGIITQLTLKVLPLPQRSTLAAIPTSLAGLASLLDQLHASRAQPVCVDVLSPQTVAHCLPAGTARDSEQWLVVVGFEGDAEVVVWQMQQLRSEIRADCAGSWSDADAAPLWQRLADEQLAADVAVSIKANILPSAVADFLQFAEPLVPRLHAHAGNGIVWGHLQGSVNEAAKVVRSLRERAVQTQGNLIVTRCPNEWTNTPTLWGQPRGDWELMRTIKQTLDPRGVFNPGRFVDSYNNPS